MKIPGATATCREVVLAMTDYLDGAMRAEERAVFEQHLAACRICKDYLRDLRTTIAITGTLRAEDAEAAMPEETRRALLDAFRTFRGRKGDR